MKNVIVVVLLAAAMSSCSKQETKAEDLIRDSKKEKSTVNLYKRLMELPWADPSLKKDVAGC
jgi:hypothetical protein